MKIHIKHILITLGISMLTSAALAQDQSNSGQSIPTSVDANMPVTAQHFVWQAALIDMKEIQMGELALQKSDNTDVKNFATHMITSHKKACQKLQAIAENEGLKFPDTNSVGMNWDERLNGGADWNTNASTDTNVYTTTETPRGQGSVNTAATPDSTMDTNANTDTNTYTTTEIPRGQHLATNMDNEVGGHAMNLNTLSGTEFDRAYAAKMVMGHEQAIQKFEMASANLQYSELKKYADKMLPTLRAHLRMAEELKTKVGMLADNK